MDLPHLNVLTKIDRLSTYVPLPFNLDFYTEVQDLSYLLPHLEEESSILRSPKFAGLNQAIIELVEGFGLVAFEVLAVEDKKSMMHLLQVIDRAGGYAFGSAEGANDTVWQVAMREGVTTMDVKDVQERWLDAKDAYDEVERKEWEEQAKREGKSSQRDPGISRSMDENDELDDLDGMYPPPGDSGIKVIRKK